MCKLNIEKCIERVNNKFELVLIASDRARNLILNKVKPFIELHDDKPTVTALKEISDGHNIKILDDIDDQ